MSKRDLTVKEEAFLKRLMKRFNVPQVNIEKQGMGDISVTLGSTIPVIRVGEKWSAAPYAERCKRLLHEFLHIAGMRHDARSRKAGYYSKPERDKFSEEVYHAFVGSSDSQNNPLATHYTTPYAARSIKEQGFDFQRFGQGLGVADVLSEPAGIFVLPTEANKAFDKEARKEGLTVPLKVRYPSGKVWKPTQKQLEAKQDKYMSEYLRWQYGFGPKDIERMQSDGAEKLPKYKKAFQEIKDALSPQSLGFRKYFAKRLRDEGYIAVENTDAVTGVTQTIVLDPSKLRVVNPTAATARRIGSEIGINWVTAPFSLSEFRAGLKEELEHKDVTGGDLLTTGKIALAHLKEDPKYYQKLAKVFEHNPELPRSQRIDEFTNAPTAVMMEDGSIYYGNDPTHLLLIERLHLPKWFLASGGYIKDGVYYESSADTPRIAEQAKAQKRLREKRGYNPFWSTSLRIYDNQDDALESRKPNEYVDRWELDKWAVGTLDQWKKQRNKQTRGYFDSESEALEVAERTRRKAIFMGDDAKHDWFVGTKDEIRLESEKIKALDKELAAYRRSLPKKKRWVANPVSLGEQFQQTLKLPATMNLALPMMMNPKGKNIMPNSEFWQMSPDELSRLDTAVLDRAAFGITSGDIVSIMPERLSIQYDEDLKEANYQMKTSGLTAKQWAQQIKLSEPIQVTLRNGKYEIDDGHHRYLAAKILKKPLKAQVEIDDNPITAIYRKAVREGKPVPEKVRKEYSL